MSSWEKRLGQMRSNPKGDWQMKDLEAVAGGVGLKVRKSGGSHAVISHASVAAHLTVPARRPIKPIYIKKFVALVDEIRGLGQGEA